jgi:hypothetical protein
MSCDEVLETLQLSLQLCKDNKQIYVPQTTLDIHSCENIARYKTSLIETHTSVNIETHFLQPNVKYAIEYNVRKRLLTLYTDSDSK